MDVTKIDQQQRPKIVIVEDDHPVRRSTQLLLQAQGFSVKAFSTGVALLADDAALDARCLIADYLLEDIDGIGLLLALRERGWMEPAILVTGYWTPTLVKEARTAGFSEVLEKPVKPRALVKILAQLISGQSAN
ncbi:MAG: response regulator [Erythrobacter sp.]|nr:response regulator [Erythrobacter sp.]